MSHVNPHAFAATRILSKALGVMMMEGDLDMPSVTVGMLTVPDSDGRVTVTFTTLSGDTYELSCKWMEELSP